MNVKHGTRRPAGRHRADRPPTDGSRTPTDAAVRAGTADDRRRERWTSAAALVCALLTVAVVLLVAR